MENCSHANRLATDASGNISRHLKFGAPSPWAASRRECRNKIDQFGRTRQRAPHNPRATARPPPIVALSALTAITGWWFFKTTLLARPMDSGKIATSVASTRRSRRADHELDLAYLTRRSHRRIESPSDALINFIRLISPNIGDPIGIPRLRRWPEAPPEARYLGSRLYGARGGANYRSGTGKSLHRSNTP